MTKTSLFGLIVLLAGAAIYGFQKIGYLMDSSGPKGPQGPYVNVSFMDALGGPDNFQWIDRLPAGFMQSWADTFIHWPLFLILIVLGGLIMLINGIFAKK